MSKNNKAINYWKIILLITILFAFAVSIFLVVDFSKAPDLYNSLIVLPACYCVGALLLLLFQKNGGKSLILIIFIIGFFIKLVITPLFFAIGGYVSFYSNALIDDHMLGACLFLGAEFVIIALIVSFS